MSTLLLSRSNHIHRMCWVVNIDYPHADSGYKPACWGKAVKAFAKF